MKITISQKLLFCSCIILGGLGFVGYTDYKGNREQVDSFNWVEHTKQIIYQSGNILSIVKDVEIALESFWLTGDSAFLEPRAMPKPVFANFAELKQLTKDNRPQENRVDSLILYVNRYFNFSSHFLELQKQKQVPILLLASVEQSR